MRFIGFGDYDWEDDGYWCAVPQGGVGQMALQPTILQRPGTTPTFGVNTLSERNFSVEFGYNGSLTYEAAWDILLTRLEPTSATPRQLRAVRNDGIEVAINAVLVLRGQNESVNTLLATFVSVDPFWSALEEATVTKTITTATDNVIPVQVTGFVQPEVLVSLRVTANRTTASNTIVGYKYRRTVTITNASGRSIPANYPYAITFDANAAFAASPSKLRNDMADLRVVRNGAEIARTLSATTASGQTSLRIWIRLAAMAPGATQQIELWYGNANVTGAPPTHTATSGENAAITFNTTGASASTNTSWNYTSRAMSGSGNAAQRPEQWTVARISGSNRDFMSVAFGTTGAMDVRIARAGDGSSRLRDEAGFVNNTSNDSIYFINNAAITSLSYSLQYRGNIRNENDKVALAEIYTLIGVPGGNLQVSTVAQSTFSNIVRPPSSYASFTPAPNFGSTVVTQVAISLLPLGLAASVDASGTRNRADRANVSRAIISNMVVNLSATITNVVGNEDEVYEWATQLRIGGGNATSAPAANIPYAVIRIGNWDESTNLAGRYVTPLNTTLTFNATTGNAYETTPGGVTLALPASAYQIRTRAASSSNELAAQSPLYGLPVISNPISNATFATNVAGWSRGTTTAGVTAAAMTRVTSPADRSSPANGVAAVVQSVGASTSGVAWEQYTTAFVPAAGRAAITVAAEVRSTNASLYPLLGIWFYTAAKTFISRSLEAAWAGVTANTWFRRCHTATVPANAVFYRVGIVGWQSGATPQTGTLYLDDVTVNGNDVMLDDTVGSSGFGTIEVTATWKSSYP